MFIVLLVPIRRTALCQFKKCIPISVRKIKKCELILDNLFTEVEMNRARIF